MMMRVKFHIGRGFVSVDLDRVLPWLVFVIALLVTHQIYLQEHSAEKRAQKTSFDFRLKDAVSQIEQKIMIYDQALVGLQSFFEASEVVERNEFHNYVYKLLQDQQHQGIVAIGYAEYVKDSEKQRYQKSIRRKGLTNFTIFPELASDRYAPIVYIEPNTPVNLRKLGYDAYSDEVRRKAMDAARDVDQATLSAKVLFLTESETGRRPGFLIYLPIYRNGALHNNVSEKRASLAGWVFLKLDSEQLIDSAFAHKPWDIDIRVFDGKEAKQEALLFSRASAIKGGESDAKSALNKVEHLDLLGHEWVLAAKSLPAFDAAINHQKSRLIAVMGLLASLALMALVQSLVTRARAREAIEAIDTKLRDSEQRWKFALEGSGDGVWDWNLHTNEVVFSRLWKEMLGYHEAEIVDGYEAWKVLVHPDDLGAATEALHLALAEHSKPYSQEYRMKCKDGSWKWVLDRGMVISFDPAGKPLRMVGTHTDITFLKKSEETIWRQANFDSLTGLPNRRMFYDRLEQELKKAHRADLQLALIFLDLDRFKEVNDTLGHYQGDTLLQEAARRLSACVREADTVARLGGDEFIIILGELEDAGVVERIAQKILMQLAEPFRLDDEVAYVAGSLGITLYPSDAVRIGDLVKNVDQAMYAAKNMGGNRYSYFTPSMQARANARMQMANDLRAAISEQQFWLAYQPIVDLRSGAIHKAEALLRWQHPTRGLVSPAEFIPVAEDTGMIIDIGEWVFHEAVKRASQWREILCPDFQISINKSPAQFYKEIKSHTSWFDYIKALGLPGSAVVVEITEGLILDASENVTNILLEFLDAGIQVSLDDFGTGYSSLSYLKKFDIDYLKIDRSFVANLEPDSDDLALCEAMIVMAHKLGIRVIAEGVETEVQRDLLQAAGCDFAQGFLFSPGVSAENFEKILRR